MSISRPIYIIYVKTISHYLKCRPIAMFVILIYRELCRVTHLRPKCHIPS
jgi:hypothetical protein